MAKEDNLHPLPEDRPDFPGNDEMYPDNGNDGGGGSGGTTPPVERTWWQKHGMAVIGIGTIILFVTIVILAALA